MSEIHICLFSIEYNSKSSLCGATGETTCDITKVTCQKCIDRYNKVLGND